MDPSRSHEIVSYYDSRVREVTEMQRGEERDGAIANLCLFLANTSANWPRRELVARYGALTEMCPEIQSELTRNQATVLMAFTLASLPDKEKVAYYPFLAHKRNQMKLGSPEYVAMNANLDRIESTMRSPEEILVDDRGFSALDANIIIVHSGLYRGNPQGPVMGYCQPLTGHEHERERELARLTVHIAEDRNRHLVNVEKQGDGGAIKKITTVLSTQEYTDMEHRRRRARALERRSARPAEAGVCR